MSNRPACSEPALAALSSPSAPEASSAATPAGIPFGDPIPQRTDVAIVGGGFSGLCTAIGILERDANATVAVFERRPRSAPGVAYGGCEPVQLLNVRADRMGADANDPTAFSRWLALRHPGRFAADDFVPRSLYGHYLNEVIARGIAPHRSRLALVRASVEGLASTDEAGARLQVRAADGRQRLVEAGAVVLALGLPSTPPAWPGDALEDSLRDPWAADAYDGIDPNDPVVIIGTGLTALDVLVSLASREHHGSVTFVSRNGRFPLPHSEPRHGIPPLTLPSEDLRSPRTALRAVRRLAARCLEEGRPWQDAVDAVRPHTTATWQRWSDGDRASFLRHLRPQWEVHRHRAPMSVLRILHDRVAAGQVRVLRGTIERLSRPLAHGAPHVRASVMVAQPDGTSRRVDATRVFHCIGPAMRVDQSHDPLMRALLTDGAVSTDAAALGLSTDGQGRARRADGSYDRRLFVLGAMRRGELWESTAVPELRLQVATVANEVARSVAARPSFR